MLPKKFVRKNLFRRGVKKKKKTPPTQGQINKAVGLYLKAGGKVTRLQTTDDERAYDQRPDFFG